MKQSRHKKHDGTDGRQLESTAFLSWRVTWFLSILILTVGVGLRAGAIFNDLWLDEIWSLKIAGLARTPMDIFFRLTHDNNHPLNTFFLWLVGNQASMEVYRIMPFVAGVGILWMFVRLSRVSDSAGTMIMTMALAGFSYLLINHSSEARGYAFVMFFSMVSIPLARRAHEEGGIWSVLLGCVILLGVVSHATFLFVYAGICVWTAVRMFKYMDPWFIRIKKILCLHIIPIIGIGIYLYAWRNVKIGGGDHYGLGDALMDLTRQSFGLPAGAAWAVAVGVISFIIMGMEIFRSFRKQPEEGWFMTTILLVAPLCALLMSRSFCLYPRYFMVCIPIAIILVGRFMGRWMDSGGWRRGAVILMLIAYCIGNGQQIYLLLRHGRGEYMAALSYISKRTQSYVVKVGGVHDFRIGTVINYYASRMKAGHVIEYTPGAGRSDAARPEWFIIDSSDGVLEGEFIRLDNGTAYGFQHAFPQFGCATRFPNQWFIFHIINSE